MNTTTLSGSCISCNAVMKNGLKSIKNEKAAVQMGTIIYMETSDCKKCGQRYVSFSNEGYEKLYEK